MFGTLLFKAVILLSPVTFLLPVKGKAYVGLAIQVILAAITTQWAFAAWNDPAPLLIDLAIPYWGGNILLVIDRLSAVFIILINIVSVVGAWYGSGYLTPYYATKSKMALSLHTWALVALHASMLHVVMLREGFGFLMAWEVMSMSSFLLVIFDAEDPGNLTTGIKYLIQMHAGFTFLLLGFLWIAQVTGIFGFDGLEPYFSQHTNWILFLVLFAGFGIKAGFMPLHTWLPHAHPAAPSSISGIMSGVMIKMGIYGIIRVLMAVQSDFLIIGLFLLVLSLITAAVAILYASMQHDLKKLLAYSSIENIGIIGVGLGIAVLGIYYRLPALSVFGITGSLLHVLNHGLYKSLLFFTVGNVYYATHTREINKLGGLMKSMPVSGGLFLIGSLSICALPPLNGFVSEFLLYSGIFNQVGTANFGQSMIYLATVLTLVVVGGLSVYAFTKAFGLGFLGSSRTGNPVAEVPLGMRLPGMVLVVGMLGMALLAPWVIMELSVTVLLFSHAGLQPSLLAETLPTFNMVSLISAMVLAGVVAVYFLRVALQRHASATGPTWGCGYSAGDARHQYTATSYQQYLGDLAGPVVSTAREYTPIQESEVFPAPRAFKTEVRDVVEEEAVLKPVSKALDRMTLIGWAQTGKINHYLVYPLFFLLAIALLTRFGLL